MSTWSLDEMETAELYPRLVWDSVYEGSGYLGLQACLSVVCGHLCTSFTTLPALDGLHSAALSGQARLKPLVTLVHGSDASAPSAASTCDPCGLSLLAPSTCSSFRSLARFMCCSSLPDWHNCGRLCPRGGTMTCCPYLLLPPVH